MLEVQDIFMQYGEAYRECHKLSLVQHKAVNAIQNCRTSKLGRHMDRCLSCGYEKPISKNFLAMLKPRVPNVDQNLLHQCSMLPKGVVVYCKPLFRDAACVVEYLERYTHRVAIFNHRIVNADHDTVFSSGAIIGTAAVGK